MKKYTFKKRYSRETQRPFVKGKKYHNAYWNYIPLLFSSLGGQFLPVGMDNYMLAD